MIPWTVTLSWLENAHLCPLVSAGDFDPWSKSDWPSFGVQSGFISLRRSVHTRLQISVCSGYDLCQPG